MRYFRLDLIKAALIIALYVTYLPVPLVLLTEEGGSQNVYIAPEAYNVAKAEFKDSLDFWENALPDALGLSLKKVRTQSSPHFCLYTYQRSQLSGRKVLLINGEDPFVAVEANAAITGGYQSHATRQNSYDLP